MKKGSIHSRPPWIPTGSNIYTRTHWDFFPDSVAKKTTPQSTQTETKSSSTDLYQNYDYYYVKEPSQYFYEVSQPKSSVYTFTKQIPAKTTIKTTINMAKPNQQYVYTSTDYNANKQQPQITYLPPVQTKTHYNPIYLSENESRSLTRSLNASYGKLKPILKTDGGGKLYSHGTNEIHYVSGNAKVYGPKVRVLNSEKTWIHE